MLIREYRLKCDECGVKTVALRASTQDARVYAKKMGWTRVVASYRGSKTGRDLCPQCSQKEAK